MHHNTEQLHVPVHVVAALCKSLNMCIYGYIHCSHFKLTVSVTVDPCITSPITFSSEGSAGEKVRGGTLRALETYRRKPLQPKDRVDRSCQHQLVLNLTHTLKSFE